MQTSAMPSQDHKANATLIGVLDAKTHANLPQFLHKLSAGSPTSTADDIKMIDLNTLCLQHPTETFLYQAGGESMVDAGIDDGDYLLVDRQLEAKSGQLVAASYFNETLIKEMVIDDYGITLIAHSDNHKDLVVEHPEYFIVIGVVTWVFADKRGWRG
ncbi:LexA family protein [Psychrobacter aquaticus]|uniref:Error-prone repair protein UmuD n=1 Tax=Psychrobacter aquaticus CMS 56 TaxID=1354303 RepID=U4T7P9_9GAMM|nr:S24 family peptidase [Psychrobacter aquaticus]ERL56146.1 Error-prone repair protein UmuD [Psychrobacter aquaticus CMS 56]